jgi:RimJ/RimL family protein N-acetyltransferase
MSPRKPIHIRPLERKDLPLFVEWLSDPQVMENLGIHNLISMAREERWFESILEHSEDEHPYVIEINENGKWRVIGNMSLFRINSIDRSAEIGIVIGDKTRWNKGYGCEAMKLMVRRGFNDLGLHRIELRVFDSNPRGIRCYEKAGFVHESRLRQAAWKNGRFVDVLIMSVLQPEWKEKERGE